MNPSIQRRRIARIAMNIPLPTCFDYYADHLSNADIGKRVSVPFGKRNRIGIVWGFTDTTQIAVEKIRVVGDVLDAQPLLDPALRALLEFCSQYYHYPIGATIFTALPTHLRKIILPRRRLKAPPPELLQLTASGIHALATLSARATRQHTLRDALLKAPYRWTQLLALHPSAGPILRQWLASEWIETIQDSPLIQSQPSILPGPSLTADQQSALLALRTPSAGPSVLFGVTGAGKTEIYLNRIADVLAAHRQALLLAPEIGLTPQLYARLQSRFPTARIACLHSHSSEAVRASEWAACLAGERDIVLGTRLAVFAPLPNLGIILIDEEQDGSYKQQDGLRYCARDVALKRGQLLGIPVILGSATPALETWWNMQQGRYQTVHLRARAAAYAHPPDIQLIDTRHTPLVHGISETLWQALTHNVHAQEQSLLFLNRRGFAPMLFCNACAWQAGCPHCAIRLTWHRRNRRLICHHCSFSIGVPVACPDCGNIDLKPIGIGTEQLEDAVHAHLPNTQLLRIDRDNMQRKGSWERVRTQIMDGQAQILIGTQMLTKGHDFPGLTLVGVLQADMGLYSSDFRATERLFAQLLQVAGRAGRGQRPGRVFIQTRFPEHPLFDALRQQDYARFATDLLHERARWDMPPHTHQALLRADAVILDHAIQWLQSAKQQLKKPVGVHVFDLVPALLSRANGRERVQFLLQAPKRLDLQRLLHSWIPGLYSLPNQGVRWSIDVDPFEI